MPTLSLSFNLPKRKHALRPTTEAVIQGEDLTELTSLQEQVIKWWEDIETLPAPAAPKAKKADAPKTEVQDAPAIEPQSDAPIIEEELIVEQAQLHQSTPATQINEVAKNQTINERLEAALGYKGLVPPWWVDTYKNPDKDPALDRKMLREKLWNIARIVTLCIPEFGAGAVGENVTPLEYRIKCTISKISGKGISESIEKWGKPTLEDNLAVLHEMLVKWLESDMLKRLFACADLGTQIARTETELDAFRDHVMGRGDVYKANVGAFQKEYPELCATLAADFAAARQRLQQLELIDAGAA